MKHILIAITLVATICMSAFAQNKGEKFRKWMDDMRQVKVEYVAKELKLTAQQKEKFTPVYEAMNREIGKVNRETRALEKSVRDKGNSATDLEYDKATEAMVELKGKECEIEKKYREQFKTILTKKQLFDLSRAERKFARELMRQHRAGKHNKR